MNARMIMAAGAATGALWLAGCTPPHPHHYAHAMKTIDTLDCPDSQGDLTRKSQSADGKTCVYADGSDSMVTLQLLALNGGDAKSALEPVENDLKAELPAKSDASAEAGAGGDSGRVDIDLPGIHIHASGKNDAKVDVGGPGKDGDGGAGVSIDAHDKDARISINESGSGVRLSYILASDDPGPHGYKSVSYDARGPSAGPLAVVTIKSKSDDLDDLRDAARELLRRNVGG
jgi:hypothetical protein